MNAISLFHPSPYTSRNYNRNVKDLIINLLALSILAVSLGLGFHYGLHASLGKMIKIFPNFSMSIELMVASGLGFVTFFTLGIQFCRNRFLTPLVGIVVARSLNMQKRVRYELHPLADQEEKKDFLIEYGISIECAQKLLANQNKEGAKNVVFETRDQVRLPGYWQFQGHDRPTVICFHEQKSWAERFAAPWGKYYVSLGFNVLIAEFRGYGASAAVAGGVNQELEAYLDAEAALKFVLEQGCISSSVIAHGSSLGGAYAAALGDFFEVSTVILDHSFTSPHAVASSIAKVISEHTFKEALTQAYFQGIIDADPAIGIKPLVTDCFNSLQKMKNAHKTDLFVIQGKKDPITPEHFGRQFMKEKYKHDVHLQQRRLALVEGGHSPWEFFDDNISAALAQEKLRNFLIEKKFITESLRSTFIYRRHKEFRADQDC